MHSALEWEQIDTVLLDMDGTVLDLSYDNHFWQELVPNHYAQAQGLSEAAARAALAPKFEAQRGLLNWYCVDYWSRETGLDIVQLKRAARAGIRLHPDSEKFLHWVCKSGRQLWLVTNAHPTVLALKMECTGISDHFAALISAHTLGAPKEDARFWPALCQQHPFDPQRTLLVDDTPTVLAAARDYGLGGVMGIRNPDSSRPSNPLTGFASVERLADLVPA